MTDDIVCGCGVDGCVFVFVVCSDDSCARAHAVLSLIARKCVPSRTQMLCEICKSPSADYLQNMMGDGDGYAHVENVRMQPPQIRWHIQNYHYEIEVYFVEVDDYNSDGERVGSHQERRTRRVMARPFLRAKSDMQPIANPPALCRQQTE